MAKSGYERVKDCIARNYDKVYLFIPKGKKAEIQALAAHRAIPAHLFIWAHQDLCELTNIS